MEKANPTKWSKGCLAFLLGVVALLLVPSAVRAGSALGVSLQPADRTSATCLPARQGSVESQDESAYPYRNAVLTVENPTGQEITAVSLRWRQGGPKMVFPVTILPGAKAEVPVVLPAIAPTQTYEVQWWLRDKPDAPCREFTLAEAEISWPVELLTTGEFIDPAAYESHLEYMPAWPGRLKRTIFLVATLFVLAVAGVLLVPWKSVRLILLGLFIIAASAVLSVQFSLTPTLLIRPAGSGFVLTCRRTQDVSFESFPLVPASNIDDFKSSYDPRGISPVYFAPWQMKQDNMTVHATEGASLTITPREIRLFRLRSRVDKK